MHPHQQPENPRRKAGLLSQVLFIWIVPLFKKGFRRILQQEDIYRVLPEDESDILGDRLEIAWNKELERCEIINIKRQSKNKNAERVTPSLTRVLCRVYGPIYAAYGFFSFYEECVIKTTQPICLGLLLRYFTNPKSFEPYTGYVLALAVTLLSLLYTSSDHPFTFAVQHLGLKTRVSLCSLIYRKALRVSKMALEETTGAQIVNFLSSDMNRFDVLYTFLHYIWVAPVQLVIVILILYMYLKIGWPCLTGIALIIVFVPFQGMMGKLFGKLRSETAGRTDKRLLLMEEIVGAMRVIKMYAWEGIFMESVSEVRLLEVKALKKTAFCKAINQSMFYVTSRITLFLTLLAYILSGNDLSSEVVFVTLALYQNVQYVLTLFFPAAVTSLAETMIAIRRFQDFLLLDEFHKPLSIEPYYEGDMSIFYFNPKDHQHDGDNDTHQKGRNIVNNRLPLSNNDDVHGGFEWDELLDNYQEEDISAVAGRRFGAGKMKTKGFANVGAGNIGITIKELTAQWNSQSKELTLNGVSLEVKGSEIVCVIGPVGAGKGSVLQAILGELPSLSGHLEVCGSIGYCSQEPWIFPGSVRENILFGQEFDVQWYERVVDACALTRDFSLLPYGDHTLVGDRGTALSGGQRARINLARAIYADADIYLLDDPLSAVDTEVGRHLVNECILGLLKDKARILVTHQLQYLSLMNRVLLLIEGTPHFYGTCDVLLRSGNQFLEILRKQMADTDSHSTSTLIGRHSHHIGMLQPPESNIHLRPSHQASSTQLVIANTGKTPLDPYEVVYEEGTDNPQTTASYQINNKDDVTESSVEEELGSGGLSWRIYWEYFSVGSSCSAVIVLFIIAILTQVVFTCTDFFLQYWIEAEEKAPRHTPNRNWQIAVYASLIGTLFIMSMIRSVNYYRVCMQTSVTLHKKLLYGVIRSPMSFFEQNPMGRILNRFAKDIGVIDEALPSVSYDTLEILLQALGVIVVVSSSSPIMLVPAVIMGALFYFIRNFYFHSARAIKRLEGVARSPVFAHISTTLYGITTIRAFGAERIFKRQFEEYLDVHSSVWYLFLASTRWLGIVVDLISILFVASVLLNCLLMKQSDSVAGLAITSAMMLTSMLQWGIRQSAELANQMICVERVLEYCSLEPEAPWNSLPDFKPPSYWPEQGGIKLRNLSLKYKAESDILVLTNLNCTIQPGERIGIVGRTGAGKSSLLSVLFRIAEPSEGFVEIDGIITSAIGLHDLRRKISIIPQEPVLFLGSIRKNLDPFSEYEDQEIWTVLHDVNLDEAVQDLTQGLYAQISEGGSNFSVGQKQLFCLARAILRNNQILVLDEATANVDPETDAVIQTTLRKNFARRTVITIAHRLHTVMDSDRMLVLDAGKIVEFEEPDVLLQDRKSALYQLVQQSGKSEAANLLYIARKAATKRRIALQQQDL